MTIIDGIQQTFVTWEECPYLLITADKPLYTLNSSIWRGGFTRNYRLINRQVDKNYHCADPVREMEQFLTRAGMPPTDTAGMLTAARVRDAGSAEMSESDVRVSSWVTAGLSNPARSGSRQKTHNRKPGTINTIVLVEANLTDSAMVNAVMTATEAKAAALQDLMVRCRDEHEVATGTTSDAIIIAATQTGVLCPYAGTATELGYMIGRTVYDAVYSSAKRNLDYWRKHGTSQ